MEQHRGTRNQMQRGMTVDKKQGRRGNTLMLRIKEMCGIRKASSICEESFLLDFTVDAFDTQTVGSTICALAKFSRNIAIQVVGLMTMSCP